MTPTCSRSRALLFAALTSLATSLALTACGKKESAEPDVAASVSAPAEGAPQIVTSVDGVHIEYHVYGRGEPAVVLIHGWSCDSNYWKEQLEALREHYTTVTVDLAGHGASGTNRTDWSMGNFGEDVAAVVRQIRNQKVVLVGHSMGAPVALEAARRIGDRVVGIVAVDSLKTIGQPVMPEAQLERVLQPFRENFIGHTREFVTDSFFTPDADPKFVNKVAYDMSLAPPEIAVSAMQSLLRMDYTPLLAEIRVPVVAINSSLGQAADEARIKKVLPSFKARTLENTGHFLMMEAPERFNPVLLEEIEGISPHS